MTKKQVIATIQEHIERMHDMLRSGDYTVYGQWNKAKEVLRKVRELPENEAIALAAQYGIED